MGSRYVVYHSADMDGLFSAAIVKMRYKDAKMIPYDYCDPYPFRDVYIDPDDVVYVLDVCFDIDDMLDLNEDCSLVWIDHHETVIKMIGSHNIPGIQSTDKAACGLTWDYFTPMRTLVPRAIALANSYDSWSWVKENDLQPVYFNYGIMSLGLDMTKETDFLLLADLIQGCSHSTQEFINKGKIISKYAEQHSKRMLNNAIRTEVCGVKTLAVNTLKIDAVTQVNLYNTYDVEMLLMFERHTNHWSCGLRSDSDSVNCGQIAQELGGGGHPGSGGFLCKHLEFDPVFTCH